MTDPAERPAVAAGDPFWGAPLVGLLYLVSVVALLGLAWLVQRVGALAPGFGPTAQAATFTALAAAGVAASWLALRYALPRRGWAELHADRVVLHKRRGRVEALRWSDLAGYSLPAEDYVQLHLPGEARPDLARTIPTPLPETRERVVELLRRGGLEGPAA